jgi:hypothetical protein
MMQEYTEREKEMRVAALTAGTALGAAKEQLSAAQADYFRLGNVMSEVIAVIDEVVTNLLLGGGGQLPAHPRGDE